MISVIQRVKHAAVTVGEETVAEIEHGMLVLVAVHATDDSSDAEWTARKLVSLRIFAHEGRNFDRDVTEVNGSILLVSNFTVAAEISKGRRPSLSAAASPDVGRAIFDQLVAAVEGFGATTKTGRFGADMRVTLSNDGPVTFILDSRDR